jgi:shikimate kinase
MIISLIGYRGTGKTTVAKQVALVLGCDWVDADVEIELRAGKSIAAIFADDGEPAFRQLESQMVAELCQRESRVVAWGGGVVLRAENRKLIKAAGPVFWLTATAETLHKRITADAATAARRPNLTSTGGITEITRLLAEREPLYRECATQLVDTEDKAPAQIAAEIVTAVRAL